MQRSAHRQCDGEAKRGIELISTCKPSTHTLAFDSGIFSSSTRAVPPSPLYAMWIDERWPCPTSFHHCMGSSTLSTMCRLMNISFVQRMAKTLRSTSTKQVVRGNTSSIHNSAERPATTAWTASGISVRADERRSSLRLAKLARAGADRAAADRNS
eukprot:2274281-Prymnesium_polylepis.1